MWVTTIHFPLFWKHIIAISGKVDQATEQILLYACLYFSLFYKYGQKQAFFTEKHKFFAH